MATEHAQFVRVLEVGGSSWCSGRSSPGDDGRVDGEDTSGGGSEVECGMGMGHCSMQSVMQISRPCTPCKSHIMPCRRERERERERGRKRERERVRERENHAPYMQQNTHYLSNQQYSPLI